MFLLPVYFETIIRFETIAAFLAALLTIYGILKNNIFNFNIEIVSKDIINQMSIFLILLDTKRQIIDLNPIASSLFGYSQNELIGNKYF
jgi:PAS domain-containing protein